MNYGDEFDNILDKALSEYRDAEPLAGLENRVLQRLQLQAGRRQKLWWQWSAAALTPAILAIAILMGLRNHAQRQPAPLEIARHDKASPRAVEHDQQNGGSATAQNQSRRLRKSPAAQHTSNGADLFASSKSASTAAPLAPAVTRAFMRSQFPTPAPLTSGEHALVALARTNPGALQNLTQSEDEITIAPIEIEPLAGDGGKNQGEN